MGKEDLRARIAKALGFLSLTKEKSEKELLKEFANTYIDESIKPEEYAIAYNRLQIEARSYYKFFAKKKIVKIRYQLISGLGNKKDTMYKLIEQHPDLDKIVSEFRQTQAITNKTLNTAHNANRKNT